MIRKTTVLALTIFALISAFNAPVSQGQAGKSFVGNWKLTLDFSPGPIFTYGVVADASKGYKADELGPQPLTTLGGGQIIGPCELATGGKSNGMTWRHLPALGDPATGVEVVYTTTSRSSPSTTVIRGDFSADGNKISGRAVVISDTTDPALVTAPSVFDTAIGRGITIVPYTLERLGADQKMNCQTYMFP